MGDLQLGLEGKGGERVGVVGGLLDRRDVWGVHESG